MGRLIDRTLTSFAKEALKRLGIGVTSYRNLERLNQLAQAGIRLQEDTRFLSLLPEHQCLQLLRLLQESKSQLRQDLFVLSELNFKESGFFVEFGAADGVVASNTWLLEEQFGWTGILSEPAKCWRNPLRKNRRCHIDTHCVWRESNSTLTFNEVDAAVLSTIAEYSAADSHRDERQLGRTYDVQSISLVDLLEKYDAPAVIDYLSIDTEGSEFEILRDFSFDRYRFRTITVEHNYAPQREDIFSLLSRWGYARKFPELSKFDDWYVPA